MYIFADAMTSQQKKFSTRAKQTGRRIIDGLFGNHSANQTKAREKEQQIQLQEYAQKLQEQQDRLNYYDKISKQAAIPSDRLFRALQSFIQQNDDLQQKEKLDEMLDDAKQLANFVSELQTSTVKDRATASEPVTKPAVQFKHSSIVLAMENDAIIQLIKAYFGHEYTIITCRNGWKALSEIYSTDVDMIVAEAQMEKTSGFELCTKLKSNPQTNLLPVILLCNNEQEQLKGLQQGADACIILPVNTDMICSYMRNVLHTRKKMRYRYEQKRHTEQQATIEGTEAPTASEKIMSRVMSVINKHLNNAAFNVETLANEVGVSRMHLHRKMKETVGMTPHDFIRQRRLEKAAAMLATQDMNITEVVYACGFTSTASFSTMFKNLYGMTPRDYMNQQRRDKTSRAV